jgi:hypothetical protein
LKDNIVDSCIVCSEGYEVIEAKDHKLLN